MDSWALSEPATFFTNLLIVAQCLILFKNLHNTVENSAQKIWSYSFLSVGSAAFFGAFEHGMKYILDPIWILNFKKGVLCSLAATSMLLVLAASKHSSKLRDFKKTGARLLLVLLGIKFGYFFYKGLSEPKFIHAILDYGSALVFCICVLLLEKKYPIARNKILLGIGVSVVAALIQALKIAPHPHFNHNDLYHVVQMGGLYLLYKGVPHLGKN